MQSSANFSVARKLQMLTVGLALIAAFAVVGCGPKKSSESGGAAQSSYATPEEAGQALLAASKSGDAGQLKQVLGAAAQPIFNSGDANEDKTALSDFVTKYDRMNRWAALVDGSRVLYIGADNYPFPVRLKKSADGRWTFDAQSGLDEIVTRRIGKNELLAIDAVSAIANAEELYAKTGHDGNPAHLYTALIFSTAGKHDGLYWKADDKGVSPLGNVEEFAAEAVAAAASGQQPIFDGYYIKILTAQGDHAQGRRQKLPRERKAHRRLRRPRLSREISRLRNYDLRAQPRRLRLSERPRRRYRTNRRRDRLPTTPTKPGWKPNNLALKRKRRGEPPPRPIPHR